MKKDVMTGLSWAAGMIALGLGATFARKLGYIDGDMVTRVVIGANGLMIAWFGNRMPKALAPSSRARQVNRVGGWSMTLSGLVYAGLWAFAPISTAIVGGCVAVLSGMAVTLGYCLSLRGKADAS